MLPVRALRPRTRGCEPLNAHTPGAASCGDATGRRCELVPIGETGGTPHQEQETGGAACSQVL